MYLKVLRNFPIELFFSSNSENFVEFKLLAKYTEENVNLLDILIDFCQFYATFNFETNIISVFEGKCVEHSICHQDDGELSPELYRYSKPYGMSGECSGY